MVSSASQCVTWLLRANIEHTHRDIILCVDASLCTYRSVAMVIGRAGCCFISPKELYGNDGLPESSSRARNDIKNLQINEQVVCRNSFSLVVINRSVQCMEGKWPIWAGNAESGLLLEPGFESSLSHKSWVT